jgi:hypothetical protein
MTAKKAKKLLLKYMVEELGLPDYQLTARTVNFADLERTSAVFVTVHEYNEKSSSYAALMKAFAKKNDFILEIE